MMEQTVPRVPATASSSSSINGELYEHSRQLLDDLASEGGFLIPPIITDEPEVEIVFDREQVDMNKNADISSRSTASSSTDSRSSSCMLEDEEDTSSTTSSQAVLTGDSSWNALIQAALQESPYAVQQEETSTLFDEDDSSSSCSSSSSSSCESDSESDEEGVLEQEQEQELLLNEWTDLTKYPTVLKPCVTRKAPVSTVLSDQLWQRDYQGVEQRIMAHPEEVSTRIDLPCYSQQVQGYPLHLASAMRPLPPLSIFQLLLSVYPKAAQLTDSQFGLLPLHLAAANLSREPDDKNHLQVVQALLSVYPDAPTKPELRQGQTPLQLATLSTPPSKDGTVPSMSSHAVLETLRLGQESPVQDQQDNSISTITTHTATNKQLHKQEAEEEEDNHSSTDATSVTMSISSGSFTSAGHGGAHSQQSQHPQEEQEDKREVNLSELEVANKNETESIADDASFVTARSHEQSTVQMENTREIDSGLLDKANPTELTAPQISQAQVHHWCLDQDEDEVGSILTVEDSFDQEHQEVGALEEPLMKECALAAAPKTFIPRAMQVDKLLLHLQLQVSDLVRPRKPHRSLVKTLVPNIIMRRTNPYYEIELLHTKTKVAITLFKSQPVYRRRQAIWEPVHFLLDSSIANAQDMVLVINVYHKRTNPSKPDEWIGSHQASPRQLCESVDPLPLWRNSQKAGNIRLVSYQLTSLEKSDCWRILL